MYRYRVSFQPGFTLIELLVVVSIIGVLASVVLASLSSARESAKVARAIAEMRGIKTAMEMLVGDTGLYPHKQPDYCPTRSAANNEVDLSAAASGLVATDGSYVSWKGPYITSVIDPWGNPYFLDEDNFCVGTAVGCRGVDNQTGTPDSSVLMSCGPNGAIGLNAPYPDNTPGCAYDSDNIIFNLCG
jgi:type II secretion system protein G